VIRIRRTFHCPVLLRRALEHARSAVIDLETTGLGRDRIVAVGVLVGRDAHILVTDEHRDLSSLPHRVTASAVAETLAPLSTRPDLEIVAHNAVFDVGMLERAGVAVHAQVRDTMKLLKLLDGDRGKEADNDDGAGTRSHRIDRRYGEPLSYKLKNVARHELGVRPLEYPGAAERLPFADLVRYLKSDLLVTRMLHRHLRRRLPVEDRMYDRELIAPLTPLLVRMSNAGVQADPAFVRSEGDRLLQLMERISATHVAEFGQSLRIGDGPLQGWIYGRGPAVPQGPVGQDREALAAGQRHPPVGHGSEVRDQPALAGADPRFQAGAEPHDAAPGTGAAHRSAHPADSLVVQRRAGVGPGLVHSTQPPTGRSGGWAGQAEVVRQRGVRPRGDPLPQRDRGDPRIPTGGVRHRPGRHPGPGPHGRVARPA